MRWHGKHLMKGARVLSWPFHVVEHWGMPPARIWSRTWFHNLRSLIPAPSFQGAHSTLVKDSTGIFSIEFFWRLRSVMHVVQPIKWKSKLNCCWIISKSAGSSCCSSHPDVPTSLTEVTVFLGHPHYVSALPQVDQQMWRQQIQRMRRSELDLPRAPDRWVFSSAVQQPHFGQRLWKNMITLTSWHLRYVCWGFICSTVEQGKNNASF